MYFHFEGVFNSIKSVLPAGAAIPLECERKLCLNFPNLPGVCSLYGTAEIGILARSGTADHIGFLMPHVEVKVSPSRSTSSFQSKETYGHDGYMAVKS